jgi:hypothetical protein
MRTTLTLDSDLADKLKEQARRQGVSFKEVVNSNLRRGLAVNDAPASPYKLKSRPMRAKRGLDLDQARDLADRLEDEEVLRKTSVGK